MQDNPYSISAFGRPDVPVDKTAILLWKTCLQRKIFSRLFEEIDAEIRAACTATGAVGGALPRLWPSMALNTGWQRSARRRTESRSLSGTERWPVRDLRSDPPSQTAGHSPSRSAGRADRQQRLSPAPQGPNHGHGPVPWHQDSAISSHIAIRPLVLTVWLPLVDATPENGCMWVQRAVHKGPVYRHRGPGGKIGIWRSRGGPAGRRAGLRFPCARQHPCC